MKEIEFKITEKGVRTHVRQKCRKHIVTDIDIDDDVDTIVFGINNNEINFELRDVDKVFPNVTKLFIMPNVEEIHISNFMFPNIRAVASFSQKYETGSMLVSYGHLLNSFCLKDNEVLDLRDIRYIDDYALEGCCADDIKCNNSGSVFARHCIENSKYANEPFIDGIKVYKNIIVDVDESAEDIILHKDDIFNHVFGGKKLKSLQVSSRDHLRLLSKSFRYDHNISVEKFIIDVEDSVDRFKLINLVENFLSLKEIIISDKVENLSSIDGILYNKAEKTLYYVPIERDRDLTIPEGVETVFKDAAQYSHIPSVTFPKSIKKVESNAFGNSRIVSAIFQNSQTIIENGVFQCCAKLETAILPKIVSLDNYVFYNCISLSKIIFRDGLKTISLSATDKCTNLKEVELPSSLGIIYSDNFTYIEKITIKGTRLMKGLLKCMLLYHRSNTSYTILNFKGNNIYLPKTNMNIESYNAKIMHGDTFGYYDMSDNVIIKQDTAIAEYLEYRQDDLKKYIRRSSKAIVTRYFNTDSQKEIITLINCDLVTKTTLDYIIEEADKRNWTTLKAYAVDKMQDCAKIGFKL